MKYMGGKERISKELVAFLEGIREKNQTYLEPFCGSFAVGSKMSGKRIASDAFQAIVSFHQGLQNGWKPSRIVTVEDWRAVKAKMDLFDPMTAHCGFNISFGGVWFTSYAKIKPMQSSDYVEQAYNTALKLAPKLTGVEFSCCSYSDHQPKGCLIYCDPPYAGTASYSKQLKESFDHELFWQTMREWSRNNTVVISEYNAPSDFVCVRTFKNFISIANHTGKGGQGQKGFERLFMHRSNVKLPFLTQRKQ